jgi:hypothetical protein
MKQTALADSSSVQYGRGGSINEGDIIKQHGKTGELLRIEGSCQSSCTMLLAAKNACVDPGATLYFHAAINRSDKPVSSGKNKYMASHYNDKLRNVVLANHYMDDWTFHTISGAELISKFGYRQCPPR